MGSIANNSGKTDRSDTSKRSLERLNFVYKHCVLTLKLVQWLASCVRLKIEKSNEKLRYILQYYYDKGKNAAQACEKICAVYGEGTLSKSTARKWFARFRSGKFDVKDESRSGRPITEKADEILEKVQQDKHISSVDIGMELGIDHKTVLNHLLKAGYKKKLDVWVPHELSKKHDRPN